MTCPVSSSTLRAPVAACGPETGRPDYARWWALGVLGLALLVVAVDATVLGLAMPLLSDELKPSPTEMLWIGDVYSFVIALGFMSAFAGCKAVLEQQSTDWRYLWTGIGLVPFVD